jgi:hypothetical protein
MCGAAALILAWEDYSCLLYLDEAAVGAILQLGQEGVDFFSGLDELDFDGEMVGNLQDVGGVEAMRGAETGYTLEDRGSVNAVVEEEVEQAGVDRDAVMFGAIAEIDGDLDGFA